MWVMVTTRLLDLASRSEASDDTSTSINGPISTELIKSAIASGGAGSVAVSGGARGTNDDAYAWGRLAHDVIGTPHVYSQLLDSLRSEVLDLPRATINETANAATIILLQPFIVLDRLHALDELVCL